MHWSGWAAGPSLCVVHRGHICCSWIFSEVRGEIQLVLLEALCLTEDVLTVTRVS